MKTSKNNNLHNKVSLKEILPILFSIISLGISTTSLYQSYKAQQFVQNETARQYFAIVFPSYYVAQSPDLKSEYDAKSLANLCSQRLLLTTDYWRQTKAANFSDTTRFLFLIVTNRGPGTIKDFYFSELDWKPKENIVAPNILAGAESVRSVLNKGECLALLIDIPSSYDESKALAKQVDIHFTDVIFKYSYMDLLDNEYNSPKVNLASESMISIELVK